MKNNKYDVISSSHESNPFAQMNVQITEAGITTVNKSWNQIVAFFPYYRMYYVRSGHARLMLHNGELDLHPGNIYFIPAFSVADADCERSLEHIWFHFRLDITAANYLSIFKPANEIAQNDTDEQLFCEIVNSFRSNARHSPAMLMRTDGICRYLLSRFLPDAKNDTLSEAARFIPVLQYIDEHLAENVSNTDLASVMYLSTTYFSELFTKQFGMPPRRYVLTKRLNAAATMLIERKMTIKEIAYSLGFENEIYFNRLFRKFTGMPPGAYRKLNASPSRTPL